MLFIPTAAKSKNNDCFFVPTFWPCLQQHISEEQEREREKKSECVREERPVREK